MTLLRLKPLAGDAIDSVLASVELSALARCEGGAYAEVAIGEAAALRALAFAGIAASPTEVDLGPRQHLVLAVGRDLHPLPPDQVPIDVVRLRRLTPGEASREALARRLLGVLPPAPQALARCRALLRGEDVSVAWQRRAWVSPSALRRPELRRSLRPVVFDRDGAHEPALAGRVSVSSGAFARWLFE